MEEQQQHQVVLGGVVVMPVVVFVCELFSDLVVIKTIFCNLGTHLVTVTWGTTRLQKIWLFKRL